MAGEEDRGDMEKGYADAVFQRSLWALYFWGTLLSLKPGEVIQQFFKSSVVL